MLKKIALLLTVLCCISCNYRDTIKPAIAYPTAIASTSTKTNYQHNDLESKDLTHNAGFRRGGIEKMHRYQRNKRS